MNHDPSAVVSRPNLTNFFALSRIQTQTDDLSGPI